MKFIFSDGSRDYLGVSSATFFWINIAGGITATWFDTQGNLLFTDSSMAASGQFSHTAPAGVVIGKVTFSGSPGFIAVGRVEFTPAFRSGITANLPDLVPAQIFCPAAAGANAMVRVCNEGALAAAATTTSLSSTLDTGAAPASGFAVASVPTAALAPGACVTVNAAAPGCPAGGRCELSATVNTGGAAIQETNSANNTLSLSCVVPPRI